MRARDHTTRMLAWWQAMGVEVADLAVRRPGGHMVWHYRKPLIELPLSWIRAENVRGADVYIRPARGYDWPMLFLDDLTEVMAKRIATGYPALAIRTSIAGGCHLWLACENTLSESTRQRLQSWLAARTDADPRSCSGEHLGRLAGFRNYKRGREWVNVVSATTNKPPWRPPQEAFGNRGDAIVWTVGSTATGGQTTAPGLDRSASGREWGWVCGAIAAGLDPQVVYERLCERVRPRKGRHTDAYAHHTVSKAMRLCLPSLPPRRRRGGAVIVDEDKVA